MKQKPSSSAQLGILLIARLAFDLDFQVISLFFIVFNDTFNIEIWRLAFLLSTFAIFTLFSPIFGFLSDKYGRKPFIIGGLVVFAISSGLMASAQSSLHLFVARAIAGLSNAIFFPALYAEMGDKFAYERRTRAMAIVRLAWPITFIIGVPLVGYSIEHVSWRLPYIGLALLALLAVLVIYFGNSSTSESHIPSSEPKSQQNLFKSVLLNRSALAGLIMMFCAVGSIEGLFTFFPVWLENLFQQGETEIALIFSIMGVGTLIGTLLAAGIGDKFGPKRCVVAGLTLSATCMVIIPHLQYSLLAVIVGIFILGIFFDFAMTILPAILTQLAPDARGTIMSLNQALTAGAMTTTYALSGLIWTRNNYAVIGLVFGSLIFVGTLIGYFNVHVESNSTHETNLDCTDSTASNITDFK